MLGEKNMKSYKYSTSTLALFLIGMKELLPLSRIVSVTQLDNVLVVLIIILVFLTLLFNNYTKKLFFLIGLVSVIVLYSAIRCSDFSILLTVFSILMMKNKRLDEFFVLALRFNVVFLAIHILYSLYSLIFFPNRIVLTYGRFSFFTVHPNVFSLVFLGAVMCYIWLYFDSISVVKLLLLNMSVLLVHAVTKTDALIVMIIFFNFAIMVRKLWIQKIFKFVAMYGTVLSVLFIGSIKLIFNSNLVKLKVLYYQLDLLLSRRLAMIAYSLSEYRITFFGQPYIASAEYSSQYDVIGYTLDNCFANLLIHYGAIYILIIIVAFYILGEKNDYKINVFIIAFIMYGMVESQILYVFCCPVLILIADLIYNNYKSEVKYE